jgi:hypothetical protein
MAQVITARLSRNDAQPWGFRLQGGVDFGTPLVIQKVSKTEEKKNCSRYAMHCDRKIDKFIDIYQSRSPGV